jgi:ribosome-associated protein
MPESPRRRSAPEALTAEQTVRLAVGAADAKHGRDILALNVRDLTSIADYFLLITAGSAAQAEAIYDAIDAALSAQGVEPLHVEGKADGTWILMDYADVIIHIFREESREFYGLERLWGDAPRLDTGPAEGDRPAASGG